MAVKVTDCPTVEGFNEEMSVDVVEAAMASFKTAEVLAVLLVSPLYFAVMA